MRDDPMLTHMERHAVPVALADAGRHFRGTAKPVGTVGHILHGVFGSRGGPALAAPRLKAIRGIVCAARRRRHVAEKPAPQHLEEGFDRDRVIALAMPAA